MRTRHTPMPVTVVAAAILLAATVTAVLDPATEATATSPSNVVMAAAAADPVLVGAGDIANSGDGDSRTAALLEKISGTVFTTGDNTYNEGSIEQFRKHYAPTWGRFKDRTRPVPGNHDYRTSDGAGYYEYFGSRAGPRGKGYYSYDLGDWHIIALNSNINMSRGSTQEKWLREDLKDNGRKCVLAYWHHPLFTSGKDHTPSTETRPLYEALYDYDAEVVVFGHNHHYERFAPQDPRGERDTRRGIRSFVAGMGGAQHYEFARSVRGNSEARNNDTFGVLKFTLHKNSYDWEFVPEAGRKYNDKGSGTCH